MSEKEHQQSAQPVNGRRDTESGHDSRELRKKKRTKCFLYIGLFVIFQIGIITLFALTVMKVRTPKFRVSRAQLSNFNPGTPANPSLKATMSAEFSVKNTNFGRYKYSDTTVEFFSGGAKIGEVLVPADRANWRSSRKFMVDLDFNLGNDPQISADLKEGVVTIRSTGKMNGRVDLIFIMKKKRSTIMDCTMDIQTATQTITNIVCK